MDEEQFGEWFLENYDSLLNRVTRCAYGKVDLAEEALEEALTWLAAHLGGCLWNDGNPVIVRHTGEYPLAAFLVQRACWVVPRMHRRRQRGQLLKDEHPDADILPDLKGCTEAAALLGIAAPCLRRLSDRQRAAVIADMIDNGDFPTECQHLTEEFVSAADLAAWRLRDISEIYRDRHRGWLNYRECLLRSGIWENPALR